MVAAKHPYASKCEDILVRRNDHLVWKVVNTYKTFNMSLEDMYSEGCIGLVTAARKFDPNKNMRFSTYAVAWIRQGIGRAVANSGQVRVPEYALPYIRAYKKLLESRPDATREDICQILGWQVGRLETVEAAMSVRCLVELDAPKGWRDTRPVAETLASPEPGPGQALELLISEQRIERLLTRLNDKERHVVLRNISGESMASIGHQIGMTRQGVAGVIKRAVKKLQPGASR
jgi:RNA polymerase sigma factor (sigma-70 family)